MKKILTLTLLLSLNLTNACDESGNSGFVQENDLWIGPELSLSTEMTEEKFNKIIDQADVIYAPIIEQLGGTLKFNRKWNNGTVNASAQRMGSTYVVNMYGGLAKHPAVTADAFALVVCHELGHHIGGAPKIGSSVTNNSNATGWGGSGGGSQWASNEGQSDYFAGLKCLRKMFLNDDNIKIISTMNIPADVTSTCDQVHGEASEDSAICARITMAGYSTAELFTVLRKLKKKPKTVTPDSKIVSRTNHSHPAPQCRLDTYFQAAVCDKDFKEDVSQTDEKVATCHRTADYKVGIRPLCWFKPKMQ
jgi:hypothetical protein